MCPEPLGILRANGDNVGVLGGFIHNAQGDDILLEEDAHLQFLIANGHSRGPRRRITWCLLKGLTDRAPRLYIINTGEQMHIISLRAH